MCIRDRLGAEVPPLGVVVALGVLFEQAARIDAAKSAMAVARAATGRRAWTAGIAVPPVAATSPRQDASDSLNSTTVYFPYGAEASHPTPNVA